MSSTHFKFPDHLFPVVHQSILHVSVISQLNFFQFRIRTFLPDEFQEAQYGTKLYEQKTTNIQADYFPNFPFPR